MALRVAVVGSGPAGVYATEALLRYGSDVRVDVLDSLPAPFGLVRHAVAPDHPRTQSIRTSLAKVLDQPAVRFLGNVSVGTDVTLDELRKLYDAVLVATGATADRRLGVPGEDLPGSVSATELVAWYCGHPDAPPERRLDARTVVVVGAGNVAGDVARMLARSPAELAGTDTPEHVLAALADSNVADVHVLARRGPAQARFTTRELRELGDLELADVVVDPADLVMVDEASEALLREDAGARRNLDVLRTWSQQPPTGRPRRVHLHFFVMPLALTGSERVEGVDLERTRLTSDGHAVGTGERLHLPAQLVVRAVGYRSLPMPGLPFDTATGVVPHVEGRVVEDAEVVTGAYVAGWAKRGPTGVIGTNKHDARETVRSLLADAEAGVLSTSTDVEPDPVLRLLASRDVQVVDWAGWLSIEAAEAELGRRTGRPRATVADRTELLRIAATAAPPTAAPQRPTSPRRPT